MKFQREFLFGFSESGFQFEMGFPGQEDPYSDWWIWVRDQDNVVSGVVSGHLPEHGPGYLTLYGRDHDLAEKLGADVLRIGIEWSRLLPTSTRDIEVSVERENGLVTRIEIPESSRRSLVERVNKRAVDDYKRILSDWKNRDKKLILNLNHFTLPIWIHNPIEIRRHGVRSAPAGWLNEETVIEFAKYTYLVSYFFDEYVDMWSTFNEPIVVPLLGYLYTKTGFPPGIPSTELFFTALRNEISAHVVAYNILKEQSNRPVGVIYNFTWVDPLIRDREDELKTAENVSYMYNYLFLDSVITGDSILVSSSSYRKRVDWIGVNYYTRLVVTSDKTTASGWRPIQGYGSLCTPGGYSKADRPCSDFGWEIYPEGLEKILIDVYKRYNLPLLVTENGIADSLDRYRSLYLISHLLSVVKAINHGVDVRGYLHWALVDNYEWAMGYHMRFGLVKVDFETKKRYLRPSALVYREIARNKELPEELVYI